MITVSKKIYGSINNIEEKKDKNINTLLEDEVKQCEGISIKQYNKEIDEAEAEFEKGDYITNEAMLKKVKQWQNKKY